MPIMQLIIHLIILQLMALGFFSLELARQVIMRISNALLTLITTDLFISTKILVEDRL